MLNNLWNFIEEKKKDLSETVEGPWI